MSGEIALSDGELQQLDECEDTIERGLETFYEVGTALAVIRDGRLYRAKYDTFENYCRKRWNLDRTYAHRIIESARTAAMLPIGNRPTVESQARELAPLRDDPEEMREVWREANERGGGKPTASAIREAREERRQAEPPQPEPLDPESWPTGNDRDMPHHDPRPRPAPVMLTLRTHTGEEVPYPKPQAKATFNETTGDGISWAAWSWNPVTGCLHGCDYCYARAIATRFTDTYPAGFTPLFHHDPDNGYTRLDAPTNTTIPAAHRDDPAYRRVFVCSMADLYGRWVPDEWIKQVHESMLASPQWQYILLTKFPARYAGLDLPPGAWVGTSVDEQKRVRIAEKAFREIGGVTVKWLSLEPLLEPLEFTDLSMFDWVVIGAQTETRQPGGTVPALDPPSREYVMELTLQAKKAGCRVHWKPNIRKFMWFDEYPEGITDLSANQGDRTS